MIKCGTLVIPVGGAGHRLKQEFKDDIDRPLRRVEDVNILTMTVRNISQFVKFDNIIFIAKNNEQPVYSWLFTEEATKLVSHDVMREVIVEEQGFDDYFNACLQTLVNNSAILNHNKPVIMVNCDTVHSEALRECIKGFHEGWTCFNNKPSTNFNVQSYEKIKDIVYFDEPVDAGFYYFSNIKSLCHRMFMDKVKLPLSGVSEQVYFKEYGTPANYKELTGL